MEYIEEDLPFTVYAGNRSIPGFAEIVDKAENEVVVIVHTHQDTLCCWMQRKLYHKEVQRTHGDTPASVRKLLPRLK